MRADRGDYIRYYSGYKSEKRNPTISKVIQVHYYVNDTEEYETEAGDFINERDLALDDILLPSEVEID